MRKAELVCKESSAILLPDLTIIFTKPFKIGEYIELLAEGPLGRILLVLYRKEPCHQALLPNVRHLFWVDVPANIKHNYSGLAFHHRHIE